jgi:hypothetical protein
MTTVRFAKVVEHSGRPEVYLLLTDPQKDAHFQQALKAHRLMTIQHGGGKTDFGTVGYLPEVRGEVLIFPRSLRTFADDRIIGINYDLLEQEHEPAKEEPEEKPAPKAKPEIKVAPREKAKPEPEPKPKPEPKAKAKSKAAAKPATHPELELDDKPRPPAKVLSFYESPADEEEAEEENEDVAEIKAAIRRALKALEAGKQVAAFNILKKILA